MTRSQVRKRDRASASQRRGSVSRVLPLASAIFAAIPAYAQDSGGLVEIIVTAQKREASLQDVPISVQALDNEMLEQLNVSDMDDFLKLMPSVNYQTFGPGFGRIFMRGVSSGDNGNHSGPLPSVGQYLDEQPITTIQGALDIHMYDIERVEALAGPQGTLFGASSQSGTIRIITNKPDPSGFSAAYGVEGNMVESGDEGFTGEGYVNVPISDNMAVRLVAWARHDAGYIDNEAGTRTYFPPNSFAEDNFDVADDNYNDVETYGARAALKVDLNESWTISPTVMGQVQKANGIFAVDRQQGGLDVQHYFPEGSDDQWIQGALTIEGKVGNLDLVYAFSYLDREVETESDYTDYSFYYDVLYYDLYGSGLSAYFVDDAGNFVNPGQYIQGKDLYTKQSHELRISSPSDWRFRFIGGLYMQRQFHSIEQRYLIGGLADAISVTGWPDTIWLTEQDRIDRDYAIFGEMSYDLSDQLTLTAGLRVFKAKNSLKGFFGYSAGFSSRTGEAACFDETDFDGAPCINLDRMVKEYSSTPKLSLSWKIDDEKMLYTTLSKGYRPGGVNRRGTFPPYSSDFLTNYEVGWKTTWMENRFRWNGAMFMSDWENFQFSFLGENGLTNITNAGAARIFGFESDVNWLVTDNLTLFGGFTWLNAELSEDFCRVLGPDGEPLSEAACPADDFAPDGLSLPSVPDVKLSATARYVFNIASFDAHVQGSVTHQSSTRPEMLPSESDILGKLGAYTLVDFAAGVERGNLALEVFLANAFDERGEVFRYSECSVGICGGQPYTNITQPRTLGIKFSQKF